MEEIKKIKEKYKPIDHKAIKIFSKEHLKLIEKRKLEQKIKIKTENINIKEKIQKVNLDNKNYFLENATKGNESILAQKFHPAKRKMILDLRNKKKIYEEKIIKMIKKKKKISVIPTNENQSINVMPKTNFIQNPSKIFAFGSSMIAKSLDIKNISKMENEYKKIQLRKELGKQYLEQLKKTKTYTPLVPKNTLKIEETKNKEDKVEVLKIDQKQNSKKISLKNSKKKRINCESKENVIHKKKKYTNYLEQLKLSKKN